MTDHHAYILLAHGSRDPLWKKGAEDIGHYIAARAPHVIIRCAYIELCQPSLLETVTSLIKQEVNQISVLPLFVSAGAHVLEDIPKLISGVKTEYPHLEINEMPIIGFSDFFRESVLQTLGLDAPGNPVLPR